LLRTMMERQADVLELLEDCRQEEDKTVEDGLAGHLGYDDHKVVATVLAITELSNDNDRDIQVHDLIWAGAFLDHLDTQGYELRRKKDKKRKK